MVESERDSIKYCSSHGRRVPVEVTFKKETVLHYLVTLRERRSFCRVFSTARDTRGQLIAHADLVIDTRSQHASWWTCKWLSSHDHMDYRGLSASRIFWHFDIINTIPLWTNSAYFERFVWTFLNLGEKMRRRGLTISDMVTIHRRAFQLGWRSLKHCFFKVDKWESIKTHWTSS